MAKRRSARRGSRRSGRRYKYLGRRVRDTGRPGLDRPSEFIAIARAVVRDRRTGRISRRTARGRLLLLYRLTDPRRNGKVRGWSSTTRERVRRAIRRYMEEV